MRVLITGGAGFIGSNLARALVNAGHEVVVADNLSMHFSTALLGRELSRMRFFHCDIRVGEDLDALPEGPYDRIYHLAASFANARSIAEPALDVRTNAEGTLRTLAFAKRAGVRALCVHRIVVVVRAGAAAAPRDGASCAGDAVRDDQASR